MTMNSGPMCGDNTGGTFNDSSAGQQSAGGMVPAGTSGNQSGNKPKQARQKPSDAAQELKGAASQATTAASDATRRTAAQAKDAATQVMEQAKGQAKQLTQQIKQQASEQGMNMFNEQKSRAAASLGGLGSALRCAAETLHEEQDKNLASYTDSLADSVESCASYIRDAEPRQLMNDAASFTRRRPEWVLGGAFVAGLALVRFLKASRPDSDGAQYDTGGAQYDEMGNPSHLSYATSDQFMGGDDLVSRYRTGEHPGIGGTMGDAGPDTEKHMGEQQTGGRDFARTDAARIDEGPDVAITTPAVVPNTTGTEGGTSLNTNSTSNDDATRTSPSTGLTL